MEAAIDQWCAYVSGLGEANRVFQALSAEYPPLVSLILDRACQFQCRHCIFQNEASSRSLPAIGAVLNVLGQLPDAKVVHEGRRLTRRQLPLLEAISHAGYSIGIIESGTFVPLIEDVLRSSLRFDWMDISIDGPREIHNLQRDSPKAWEIATDGVRHARRIIKSGGKLTSLTTVTSLNQEHIAATGDTVFAEGVDEWHLTTISLRPGIEEMRAGAKDLEGVLSQAMKVGKTHKKTFLRIYNLEDIRLLVSIIGKETFSRLLKNVQVTQNALVLDIGLPLFFYPASLAPSETLVVDADGWWRMPYCIKYTLEELRKGHAADGSDISAYSIAEITPQTVAAQQYQRAVACWWNYSGARQLAEERALFQTLF